VADEPGFGAGQVEVVDHGDRVGTGGIIIIHTFWMVLYGDGRR
jgi:hypothetical protein